MRKVFILITLLFFTASIAGYAQSRGKHRVAEKRPVSIIASADSVSTNILSFAQSLIGIRYRAASSSPVLGFDCSGFVNYVFKQFNFNVPRSSGDFLSAGEKVDINDAQPGDIILFKGTKTHHPHSIGHVGIVLSNEDGGLKFIHSTSGKEHGVTITAMDNTYKRRFVQVVRLIKQAVL